MYGHEEKMQRCEVNVIAVIGKKMGMRELEGVRIGAKVNTFVIKEVE